MVFLLCNTFVMEAAYNEGMYYSRRSGGGNTGKTRYGKEILKKFCKFTAMVMAGVLALSGCGSKADDHDSSAAEISTAQTEAEETEEKESENAADFEYAETAGGIVLTKYTGSEENLYIPSEIDGIQVTEIGESCFAGNITLKRVHVPEGVTALGDYAFECCSVLEKAYLPDSLLKIGNGAFSGCGYLTMADLQDNVEEIGNGAFLFCGKLISFTAPASLKKLGEFAFAGCTGMYMADLSKSQISEIAARSFYRNDRLTKVSLPETAAAIGMRAFSTCPKISDFYVPDAVGHIESYAFEGCESLSGINIPGGVVEAHAFDACYALSGIGFGCDQPITLLKDAFALTNLKESEQYLPDNVTVEEGAFPEDEEWTNGGEYIWDRDPEDEEYTWNEDSEEGEYTRDEDPEEGEYSEEEYTEEEPSEEETEEVIPVSDWDDIKSIDEIIGNAKDAGFKVVTNDEFDAWADEYLDHNRSTALFDRDKNVYTDIYKRQIEGYYKAMTAAATKAESDMEAAYAKHGDDFVPMYEMVNHGLHTEMMRFRMQEDMLLLTGVYDSQLMFAAGTSEVPTMEELKARVGSTFSDPSLTSTTNDVEVAVGFSDTMFIIYAPAESINSVGAVCMDAYMRTPENETLIFSGAEYEILDVGYFSYQRTDDESEKEVTDYEKYVLVKLINK